MSWSRAWLCVLFVVNPPLSFVCQSFPVGLGEVGFFFFGAIQCGAAVVVDVCCSSHACAGMAVAGARKDSTWL